MLIHLPKKHYIFFLSQAALFQLELHLPRVATKRRRVVFLPSRVPHVICFPRVSRSETSSLPVLLDHVAGSLGDHVRGRVRVASDYRRHHAGVDDPESVDAVHPQRLVHHARVPPRAHFARAHVVTHGCTHVAGDTGPVRIAPEDDVPASRKLHRQQRGVVPRERVRGRYCDRLQCQTTSIIKKEEEDTARIIIFGKN